jgi:hypothetical protein
MQIICHEPFAKKGSPVSQGPSNRVKPIQFWFDSLTLPRSWMTAFFQHCPSLSGKPAGRAFPTWPAMALANLTQYFTDSTEGIRLPCILPLSVSSVKSVVLLFGFENFGLPAVAASAKAGHGQSRPVTVINAKASVNVKVEPGPGRFDLFRPVSTKKIKNDPETSKTNPMNRNRELADHRRKKRRHGSSHFCGSCFFAAIPLLQVPTTGLTFGNRSRLLRLGGFGVKKSRWLKVAQAESRWLKAF